MAGRTGALALVLSLTIACAPDARKRVSSCGDDADCLGGVCYAEQCYTACTEQDDCAENELCVFEDDGASARTLQICVVAAEHAGCAVDDDCADLVAGRCEEVRCDGATATCTWAERVSCAVDAPAPVFGAWRALPVEGAPSARNYVAGAWTGTRFCLWGGFSGGSLGDGACYLPADDAWRPLPTGGAPSARCLMPEVWAGDRLCTWAGFGAGGSGACWVEAEDAWSPMAEAGAPATPRQNHGGAYVDGLLCFFGGRSVAGGVDYDDGGCYDLAAGTWQPLPADGAPRGGMNPQLLAVGGRLCAWGGWNAGVYHRGGACWTPGAPSWEDVPLPESVELAPVVEARSVGDRLCAWGGDDHAGAFFRTGACWSPVARDWHVLPIEGAPSARSSNFANAWTGDWWCLHGGTVGDETPVADGACYSPSLDRWFALPTAGAPVTGGEANGFWTGTELCFWGGRASGANVAAGGCLPATPSPAAE